MQKLSVLLISAFLLLCSCSSNKETLIFENRNSPDSINMFLNAFGVESDGFPTINARLEFGNNTSICNVSYYEPWLKDSSYTLSKYEMKTIFTIIKNYDLSTLKKVYTVNATDQPTSTTTIFIHGQKFQVEDYGLQAEYPLDEIYKIVYKLKNNFR